MTKTDPLSPATATEPAAPTPSVWRRALRRFQNSNQVTRLYVAGAIASAIAVLGFRVFGSNVLVATLFVIGAGIASIGVLIELYRIIDGIWESKLGKLCGVLLATMIGALSMAMSSQIVNRATGLDPGFLPYAVTFMAPLSAGYLIVGLATVVFVLGMLSLMLKTLYEATVLGWHRGKGEPGHKLDDTDALRFFALVLLLFFTFATWSLSERPYRAGLSFIAQSFVYELEFYAADPCAKPGERIRRLSDDTVAIARPGPSGLSFTMRTCPVGSAVAPPSRPAPVVGESSP